MRIAADVREALVEAVSGAEAVSIGRTVRSFVAQALYGTIPRVIDESVDGTVMIARGEDRTPRSLREAIVQRLGGEVEL